MSISLTYSKYMLVFNEKNISNMTKNFKFGFDLFGVIDTNPLMYRELAKLLRKAGHEVHIIAGHKLEKVHRVLDLVGMEFDHTFSINDFYEGNGTPMNVDLHGDPHIGAYLWNRAKACYCDRAGIDIHFDGTLEHADFFRTPFVYVINGGCKHVPVDLERQLLAAYDKRVVPTINLGLDLHGVINERPHLFAMLTNLLVTNGHRVHIITGSQQELEMPILSDMGIAFTDFFSITDYHISIKTEIEWRTPDNPHLPSELWDPAKATYCREKNIDLHLDDSDVYKYFFNIPYGRFYSRDSVRIRKMRLAEEMRELLVQGS
jgi:hypothetical protein